MVNVVKMIFRGKLLPYLADIYVPKIRQLFWRIVKPSRGRICLCFHDVSQSDNIFAITPQKYYDYINRISNIIIGIDNHTEPKGVVISFDDGFESLYTVVLPFMEENKLPFVCYITTDYLDKPGYLSSKQLKDLSKSSYCTVGSHMCSHGKTREMKDSKVHQEWVTSKSIIQEIIGKEIKHAALPYGSYLSCSWRSKKEALKCGYETISNTIASPYSPEKNEVFRFVYQKNVDRVERIIYLLRN